MIWLEADVNGGLLGDMDGRVKKYKRHRQKGQSVPWAKRAEAADGFFVAKLLQRGARLGTVGGGVVARSF